MDNFCKLRLVGLVLNFISGHEMIARETSLILGACFNTVILTSPNKSKCKCALQQVLVFTPQQSLRETSDLDHHVDGIHVWKEPFPRQRHQARVVNRQNVIGNGRRSRQHLDIVTPEQSEGLT